MTNSRRNSYNNLNIYKVSRIKYRRHDNSSLSVIGKSNIFLSLYNMTFHSHKYLLHNKRIHSKLECSMNSLNSKF